jgi:glucose-6-phosphate-specific signal transduction histidine kinase
MDPEQTRSGRYPRGLTIAAYVTWVAASMEVLQTSGTLPPVGSFPARHVAAVLLLVYLAGFIAASRPTSGERRWRDRWPLVLMLAALFALFMLGPSGTAPALLVVFAVLAVLALSIAQAAVLLIAANVALAAVFVFVWRASAWLQLFVIYAGFQFFAAMASHAMRQARTSADELRQVNANLLATRSLLAESARESERLRLSRELHDVSGHKLTALKLNLAVLSKDEALAARRELQASRALADELLEDIRGVVSQLREHDGIDLRNAFERLAEHLPSPRVHVEVAEDARVEDAERAATLVRLAQEGVTNSARHAGARNVWLRLTRDGDRLQLLIEDDGKVSEPLRPGHGVLGMRERVAELGGQLEIGSADNGGLRVCARLPRERVA